MYKKILAPIDGSEMSECSLSHVMSVASGCNVPEVVLMQVFEVAQPWVYAEANLDVETVADKLRRDSSEYLEKMAAKFSRTLNVKTVVKRGRAADEILAYAARNGVDLIVMSTHGRSGPSRWLLGSVADRIVRYSPVPVLTVAPNGCRVMPIEKAQSTAA